MEDKNFFGAQALAYVCLSKGVIKFAQPRNPYQLTNGLFCPFYVYDQKIPSTLLGLRKLITVKLMNLITEKYGKQLAEDKVSIAASSAGSCPWASFVAQSLNLPLVTVRTENKDYGLRNTISGSVPKDNVVLLIDDVIFTGNNSLRTLEALKKEGSSVLGTIAIMDLQVPEAQKAYQKQGLDLIPLLTFDDIMSVAEHAGVPAETIQVLEEWHKNPHAWSRPYEAAGGLSD